MILDTHIVNSYSKIHTPVEACRDHKISFEGSQIGYEFFTAWDYISEYYKEHPCKYLTFLEVGAWKGLWGIAFAEFCKLYGIAGKYVTVTLVDHDRLANQHIYSTLGYMNSVGVSATLVDMNTLDERVVDAVISHEKSYNIVFIDAGHSYTEVMNDIHKFKPLAKNMVIFHDIRPETPTENCSVYQAIQDSKIVLDREITVSSNMGIGIHFIK